jgi:signal transduction histidine kinase
MNLLVNAAQAIQSRGVNTIDTGAQDGWVWVKISDNGCGIPQDNLKRVFEPFFTTKPVGSGTGLGLSLSYSIVNKHGGRIDVASKPGVGTVFTIRLPLVPPASTAPPDAPQA